MRFWLKIAAGLVVLGVAAWFAMPKVQSYWHERHKPSFKQAAVSRGDITSVVNSTGTVQPVLSVQIGAFVSGPIQTVHVEFNARVEEGANSRGSRSTNTACSARSSQSYVGLGQSESVAGRIEAESIEAGVGTGPSR